MLVKGFSFEAAGVDANCNGGGISQAVSYWPAEEDSAPEAGALQREPVSNFCCSKRSRSGKGDGSRQVASTLHA